MTYRYLGMLIDGLPAESLTRTAERNEYTDDELAAMAADHHEHGPMSRSDLIAADTWDLLAALCHGLSGAKGDPPRYPRPGVGKPGEGGRKGRMNLSQMRLYLEKRQIGGDASDDAT